MFRIATFISNEVLANKINMIINKHKFIHSYDYLC